MRVIYYLEVLSSWCHWAEPAWDALKLRYRTGVTFDWRIALMNPGDFPSSREQCDWFYRRSGTLRKSQVMLNSGWFEQELKGDYVAPNLVLEAGRDLGFGDDRLRRALAEAALLHGRRIGRMDEAVAVAAGATGIGDDEIRARAESLEIRARVDESTAVFHALQVTQRPAFLLENSIGDRAVFSGIADAAPLAAAIDAMLADAAGYASYAAHHGGTPNS